MLQVVAATGQVLLHRFYCKQSMTDFDVKVPASLPTAGQRTIVLKNRAVTPAAMSNVVHLPE